MRKKGWLITLLVIIVVAVLAYFFIPAVRYFLIPITGSVQAPKFSEPMAKLKTMTHEAKKMPASNKLFAVGRLGNANKVVDSISQVPEEGGWINTAPLDIQALQKEKKVILIDFWTYSCINCIRATPYSEELWKRYKDYGLVVIGVHAPEFHFEHIPANIFKAVKAAGISYPVLTDGNMKVWKSFNNFTWPAKYVISPNGKVIYTQFGEGSYGREEQVIRKALEAAGWKLPPYKPTSVFLNLDGRAQTEELYIGAGRLRKPLGNEQTPAVGESDNFQLPDSIAADKVYLKGQWLGQNDDMQSQGPGEIVLKYTASTPYIVMGPASKPVNVIVTWDGKPVPKDIAGRDIKYNANGQSYIVVDMPRLYFSLSPKAPYGTHVIRFITPAGLRAYSFTFGSYG
ncbi:MAG: redoxin domain-containing protein [Gammaproteobacteria bacterium]|nr:redoxin domain-containing protein [Gammaproteobacteria bacterium]